MILNSNAGPTPTPIRPGQSNKRVHFEQLAKDTGMAFSDMLFFDNEGRNINNVERLGVTSILCPRGLTKEVWEQGLRKFSLVEKGAHSAT